jgi:superfamily II DNA helicase RecQ
MRLLFRGSTHDRRALEPSIGYPNALGKKLVWRQTLIDLVSVAVIAAVSSGAADGVKDVTKKAIVDSYEGLKGLIKKKYGSSSAVGEAIDKLQDKPDSQGRRETLAEELRAVNANVEPELLSAARTLIKLIEALPQGEQHIQLAHGIGIAQADRGGTATVNVWGVPNKKNDE